MARMRLRRPEFFWGIFAGAAAFFLYVPFVTYPFIAIDDPGFITQNPLLHPANAAAMIRAFTSFTMLLYLPLTILSYQIDASIAGIQPWMFHLTNVLLHAGCVLLVFRFLFRLTGRQIASAVAALLFAVHPLHVEAVLWAASRKDLLAAGFSLLSLLAYLRWLDTGDGKMRWISVTWYLCALLSKIAVFPLVAVFLLLDRMRGRQHIGAFALEKWPYALLAVPLIAIGTYGGSQFLVPLGAKTGFLLALKSTGYTITSMAWPANLSLLHFQSEPTVIDGWTLAGGIALMIMTGIFAWAWRAQHASARRIAFCIGFFLLLFFPTWAAAQKGGLLFFASDKYAYLPSIGLFLLAGMGMEWLLRWKPKLQRGIFTGAALVLIAFAGTSTQYTLQWQSSEVLFTAITERDPSNPVALNGLGLIADDQQKNDEALALYQQAIDSYPAYLVPYVNAAAVLAETGRTQAATDMYARMADHVTQRQVRGDPSLREALSTIATQLENAGRHEAATRMRQQLQ